MENSNNLIHSFNHTPDTEGNFHGLTKREYFAGLAMQGMISEVFKHDGHELAHAETIAIRSLRCADELLKQLEK